MINHNITVGLSTIYKKEATAADALQATGSGGILDFLVSTPAILTMIIDASSQLIDQLLPEDYITVGKNIELSHDNPTMIDGIITIVVTVKKVSNDRIYLEFSGHDAVGQICQGKYERVMVSKKMLMDSVYKRAQNML